jgi:hypothetical protein
MSAASPTLLSSVQENAYRFALQIHTLDALAKTYIGQHVAITTQMLDLEQLGVIHAAPYFHWQKYLYLIYPMKGGKRKRVYVGSDRAKIAEAEAAIERGKEYLVFAQQLHLVERQLANLAEELDLFVFNIKETS